MRLKKNKTPKNSDSTKSKFGFFFKKPQSQDVFSPTPTSTPIPVDPWPEIKALYSATHVGFCFVDRDFRYIRINQYLADINGKSVEEHIGRTIREVIPSVADQSEGMCRHIFETGEPILNFESIISSPLNPNDIKKWSLSCYPAKNEQGEIVGVFTIILDITNRKNSEESLVIQSRVLANMVEGVSLTDENGVIIYTNPAEDKLFGYEPCELIGKPASVQNPYPIEENARLINEIRTHLNIHDSWEGCFDHIKKDGTSFKTKARISYLEISGRRYFVCIKEPLVALA